MLTAVPLFYTGLVVCLNVIAAGGGSNLFLPEEFASMSQAEIAERVKGSKIVVVSEHVCQRINGQRTKLTCVVHAERHLDPQGMHVVHVCANDHRNNTYQVDQAGGSLGYGWLHSRSDCLLDSLYASQGLLEVSMMHKYLRHTLT